MTISIPGKLQFAQPNLTNSKAKTKPGKQGDSGSVKTSSTEVGSANNPEVLADNPSDVRGTESGAYDGVDMEGISGGMGDFGGGGGF